MDVRRVIQWNEGWTSAAHSYCWACGFYFIKGGLKQIKIFRLGSEQQEQQSKDGPWKPGGISVWEIRLTWAVWFLGQKTPERWYEYMCRSRINLKLFHFYGTSYKIASCILRDQNIPFKMYIHILSHRSSGELDTTRHWERAFGSDTCIFQADYFGVC